MTGYVNLLSGDLMTATLVYNGSNLTETVVDDVTKATFTHIYAGLNLSSIIGGSVAYVGFTGSTGGFASTQAIQTWTYSS